jgi:hypothetical protein
MDELYLPKIDAPQARPTGAEAIDRAGNMYQQVRMFK